MMSIFLTFLQFLFVPTLAPLVIGIIRKTKAIMQNRTGASVIQPYRDLWKLFHKDEVISYDASWVFLVAPYVVFAVMLLIGALIPIIPLGSYWSAWGDFIALISLFVLSTFFLALGGLDTGNAFGDLGSSREMTFAAMTEAGLLFAFLPVALIAGSTNLLAMSTQVPGSINEMLALIIACGAFFIALLAENARYPFDNPSTHLELTMVHEAMIIEYSGKRLALMEWAAANKLMIFLVLCVNIFFPSAIPPGGDLMGIMVALAILGAKLIAVATAIALLESTIPKLRYFRLPTLLFTSFILGLVATVMVII